MLTRCNSCNMHFMVRKGEVAGSLCPKCAVNAPAAGVTATKSVASPLAPSAAVEKRAKMANAMRARNAQRERARENDGFAMERKAIGMGVIGGILLMVVAAVWFFLGLAAGRIFVYPPILFCMGIYAIITGIYDGVTGKGKARRSKR